MTPVKDRTRWLALALMALVLTVAVAGCGGDDNDDGGSTGGTDTAAEPAADTSAEVEALYEGTYEPPPTEAPKPEPGKNIWLISCGQSISSCAIAINGAKEAAESIGWEARIFDTKGDVGTANGAIRQALAAKADGIFVWYVDCSAMRAGLEEAKAANVPVVGGEVYDCNEGGQDGPQLFTHEVQYVEGDYDDWIFAYGAAQATYLVNKIGGEGSILFFGDDTSFGSKRTREGFTSVIDECSGCEQQNVDFSFAELVAGVQQQVEQELLRNPDVNATGVAYDGVFLAGVSAGVTAANRDITMMTGEGGEAAMDLVRQG
jgi:ribose transport system substrate-binding protein